MARRPKKSEEVNAVASVIEEVSVATTDLNAESKDQVADVMAGSEAENASESLGSQCGGALRAAREQQGLSVTDVAKQLRLGNKQVEALELDHFSDLPESTIVKGFIRNYAKLLKISAEPLLAAYAELMPSKEQYAFTLNPGINMKITESRKLNTTRYFLLTLGLLLGLGIWFFYQNYVQKPNPINPIPEVIEALPELALPMSERSEEASSTQLAMPEQSAENTEEATSETSESVTDALDRSQVEDGLTQQEGAEAPAANVEQANEAPEEAVADTTQSASPAAGQTRLEFTATQETWLSVVNTSGKEVYNKILYAGNRDVVDVSQPAEIVVGNAHGATLVVDGKSIDLAPYTRINVARVRLNR
jgi:cytoskeleton protein RodZ